MGKLETLSSALLTQLEPLKEVFYETYQNMTNVGQDGEGDM